MPVATPVTIPDDVPTVAIPVLLLLHVPPLVASLRVVVKPMQTVAVPLTDAGNGLTVTTTVATQPVAII